MRAQLQLVWFWFWRGRAPLGWAVLFWLTLFQCTREQAGAQMQTTAPVNQSVAPAASAAQPVYSTRTYQKPSDEELKKKLEPLEYAVPQRAATEPAFQNRFFNQ